MKEFLRKHKKWLFPGIPLILLIGISLIWLGLTQTYTILVDGEAIEVRTTALKVSGVLQAAGLDVNDQDRIAPDQEAWVWGQSVISLEKAREIVITTPQEEVSLFTTTKIPANLLDELGITLFPQDQVLVNGQVIDPLMPINESVSLIQFKQARPVNVIIEESENTIYTHQPTLGEALEVADIHLAPQDRISHDLMTPIDGPLEVTIQRAQPVKVNALAASFSGLTAAATVGEALEDIGVPLQNLDYTIPPDDAPLPEDGQIELVRVEEAVVLTTDEVAYENEYVEDPETTLDQISVVEPGQVGIYATRERVQYENGEEVWRGDLESWQASEAKEGVLGYGSNVQIRTEVVNGREIEYWRKIYVYATAYSPCRCGTPDGSCCYGSASGLPSQKGLIAVTPNWYNMMKLQKVYVLGYGEGVIGNVGGGAHYFDHYWIDLAYSDDDYESWNRWTTMYFLPPIPAWIPNPLPWP